MTAVSGLTSAPTSAGRPLGTSGRAGGIRRGRLGGVLRRAVQLFLQIRDLLLQSGHLLLQGDHLLLQCRVRREQSLHQRAHRGGRGSPIFGRNAGRNRLLDHRFQYAGISRASKCHLALLAAPKGYTI